MDIKLLFNVNGFLPKKLIASKFLTAGILLSIAKVVNNMQSALRALSLGQLYAAAF